MGATCKKNVNIFCVEFVFTKVDFRVLLVMYRIIGVIVHF